MPGSAIRLAEASPWPILSDTTAPTVSPMPNPSSGRLPRLATAGAQLVRADSGAPVRLRGVNVCSLEFDYYGANWELNGGSSALLTMLADRAKWNANVVRMPLNQEWFITDEDYVTRVEQLIDDADTKGVYAILVDQWEISHKTDPYSLNILKMPTFGAGNTTEAFWMKVASRWSKRTNLIYDIINEPHDYQASDIAASMQRTVDTISAVQPGAVFMIGGVPWAHSVDYYRTNPLRGNVIYSVHQYMPYDDPSKFPSNFGNAAQSLPVFLGEFDMERPSFQQGYQSALLDYAETHGTVGWTAWAIGCGIPKDGYLENEPAATVAGYMRNLND